MAGPNDVKADSAYGHNAPIFGIWNWLRAHPNGVFGKADTSVYRKPNSAGQPAANGQSTVPTSRTTSTATTTPRFYDFIQGATGPTVGGGGGQAQTLTPEDIIAAFMQAGMGGARGPSQFELDTQRMSAEAQMRNAATNEFQARADAAYKEAATALATGNLALAREKFQDSQVWAARAADAQDEQNRIGGINASTSAARSAGDLINTANGQQTQRELGGASQLTSLTNILSNLAQAQGELGLKIASTPRNAIAGFLMSRGQDGGAAAAYNPGNLFGINTQMLQTAIQQASQVAQRLATPGPQMDLGPILAGLNAASMQATRQMPQITPGPASDGGGARAVGARVPTWQSVYDRMVAGGAPQSALDTYREAATKAAYPAQQG